MGSKSKQAPHESTTQYLSELRAATQKAVDAGAPPSGIVEWTLAYAGAVQAKFGEANGGDSVEDLVTNNGLDVDYDSIDAMAQAAE